MGNFHYVGSELETFAAAATWKAYLAAQIRPFLGADVLEVGAGIGSTARAFCTSDQRSWTSLEPDAALTAQAQRLAHALPPGARYDARIGTVVDLLADEHFDSILYIDVLEHIERDADELAAARSHLRTGGHLIVLSPAHQWLFTAFDGAIGHFRRYDASTLQAVVPPDMRAVRLRYLDCVGMCASLANKTLLRQAMPTARQIKLWDRGMVSLSRRLDPLLGFRIGKSILGVWQALD
jgi:cyclopropane fatty-acyl-phospholipid synthase-like methyltransferase